MSITDHNAHRPDALQQHPTPLLEVRNVTGGYGHAQILNGVSFKVEQDRLFRLLVPMAPGQAR